MKDQDWLINRIWDIMNYKNMSINKLFPLAGMKYGMELQRCLNGKNPITPTILEDIAKGLGVTLERLEQTDTEMSREELERLLRLGIELEKAEQISRKLLKIAVGAKEKLQAHRDLGWSLYNQNRFDEAREEWERAFKIAYKKPPRKNQKFTDEESLFKIVIDLSNYHISLREFDIAIQLLDENQTFFIGDFLKLGMIHQNRGLCLARLGDIRAAKQHYLVSYECYKNLGSEKSRQARIEGNLADLEFHEGNLELAIELLYKAKSNAKDDSLASQCTIDIDLARALICASKKTEALEIIDQQLAKRHLIKRSELIGKLLLMKTDITKDPTFGLMYALSLVQQRYEVVKKQESGETLTNKEQSVLEGKDSPFLPYEWDALIEWISLIGDSVLPIMAYVDLTKEQEQQLFHDQNFLAKKVSKSLSLSYNHNDKFVGLARMISERETVEPFVQPQSSGTRLQGSYLFLFSTLYKAIVTFLDKSKDQESDADIFAELEDFFDMVIQALPDDVTTGDYLYKHAGVLPGIALFAQRMKSTEKVSWRRTLEDALLKVSFASTNTDFIRYGRALLDDETKKVVFTGSNGAIAAVVKTLEALARRLDDDGHEVFEAYGKESSGEIKVISDEAAILATSQENEESQELTETKEERAQTLSKSEEEILNLIREAENHTIEKSHRELATELNRAKSSIGEALKKLETKGLIEVIEQEGGARAYKLA